MYSGVHASEQFLDHLAQDKCANTFLVSELESEWTGNMRTRYYLQYQVYNFHKYIYAKSIQAFNRTAENKALEFILSL